MHCQESDPLLQVVVDMGPPILNAADVPTTLKPTREDGSVVAAPLEVDGLTWSVTCVSMGNPHCITFGCVGSEEVRNSGGLEPQTHP